jgi:hypothetical protein
MQVRRLNSLALALGALVLGPVAGDAITTGSFTLVPSRNQFRRLYTATLLPNDEVLVVGGFNTSDTGPNSELFDPASVIPTSVLLSNPAKLQTGDIQFTFRDTPGLNFTDLSTTDLALPITDGTTNSPQRFYRVGAP